MSGTLRPGMLANATEKFFTDFSIKWIFAASLVALIFLYYAKPFADDARLILVPQYLVVFVLCIVAFKSPYWGITLIAVSFPVIMLFPSYPRQTGALFCLTAATFFGALYNFLKHKNADPINITLPHIFGGLFFVWLFVTNVSGELFSLSHIRLTSFLMLFAILILSNNVIRTDAKLDTIMKIFVGLLIISSVVGIFEAQIGVNSESSIRAEGFTGHPNTLALFAVIAIVFVVRFLETSSKRLSYYILLAAIGILFAALAFTVSRTAFLTLLILIATYSVLRWRTGQPRLHSFGIVAVIGLLLIPFGYWEVMFGIPDSILIGTDSAGFRYAQWDAGWLMARDYIWSGVGLDNFRAFLPKYSAHIVPFHGLDYGPHSIYLGLLAETGIVGLLLFLGMVVTSLGAYLRNLRESRDWGGSTFALFAATLVVLLNGLTADWQTLPLFWVLVSLAPSKVIFCFNPVSQRSYDRTQVPTREPTPTLLSDTT